MRPSQYRSESITIMIEVLRNVDVAQSFTDKELFRRLNKRLGYDHHICYRTFQRYKAAAVLYGEMEVEHQADFDPIYRDLYNAILDNQLDQKENLYREMRRADGKEWHKTKWIMERKFPDFNLRAVSQKFVDETELVEKMLLELDIHDAQTKMKADKIQPQEPTVPTEKPIKQQMWERDVKYDTAVDIPAEERVAFEQYWDAAQLAWDTEHPLQAGHRFPNARLQDEMIAYYRIILTKWETEKSNWIKQGAVA